LAGIVYGRGEVLLAKPTRLRFIIGYG